MTMTMPSAASTEHTSRGRLLVIAVISFLTLVDLFATQAILPSLARAYGVQPSTIGSAVNACTFGMALAGLVTAGFNRLIDRRLGICLSLALLSIPTALLALMPDLLTFAGLRVVQGLFMSAAFSLTIAYLGETCSARDAASALAAYVTGNVASNLVGRLVSAGIADHLGLSANFAVFAGLNLAGAALAFFALRQTSPMAAVESDAPQWGSLLARPEMRAAFAIGFIILFAFIGTFTYVNFELAGPALGLAPMQLGLVYLVFIPAIVATPLAGAVGRRFGASLAIAAALGAALLGLPLLVAGALSPVLAGLVLVGTGTFFAQAAATAYVSRAAGASGGAAGGIYLACYYAGGLAGSLVLGQIFDLLGWTACVAAIAIGLAAALWLATRLREVSNHEISQSGPSPSGA